MITPFVTPHCVAMWHVINISSPSKRRWFWAHHHSEHMLTESENSTAGLFMG